MELRKSKGLSFLAGSMVLGILAAVRPVAGSEKNACELALSGPQDIYKAAVEAANASGQARLKTILEMYSSLAESDTFLPQVIKAEELYRFIAIEGAEMDQYSGNLDKILESYTSYGRRGQAGLLNAMKSALSDQVPEKSIEKRLSDLVRHRGPRALARALGEMELEEIQDWVHGGDPLHPSPDSLIGQYLKETGAQTLIRRFPGRPRSGQRNLGPRKLVIALSQNTMPAYSRLFSKINFLIHNHEPSQGTLHLVHEGKAGHYANLTRAFHFPGEGNLLPHILLNAREGQRARNYFELAHRTTLSGQAAGLDPKAPWELVANDENGNSKPYCARGGYNSCTYWVGDIPLGDRLVDQYVFPGNVDDYAGNAEHVRGRERGPRRKKLTPYDNDYPLLRTVWKFPKGNEQLAMVLGQYEAEVSGEMANPGYVALVLLGRVAVARVPIVFLGVADEKEKIPEKFKLQIEAH